MQREGVDIIITKGQAMLWISLNNKAVMDHLGLIPSFLSEDDPRPAAEQIDSNYSFGGGWRPQPKFKLLDDRRLEYPGDPDLTPLFMSQLRDEDIFVYEFGYTAIVQKDGSFEVSRLD